MTRSRSPSVAQPSRARRRLAFEPEAEFRDGLDLEHVQRDRMRERRGAEQQRQRSHVAIFYAGRPGRPERVLAAFLPFSSWFLATID